MAEFPTGTVTFLFTNMEESTIMQQRLGDGFVDGLENHHSLIRRALGVGTKNSSKGDADFYVFSCAQDRPNEIGTG